MIQTVKPKRVLHVVSAMERGGTETLLMNVYRKIDRTKIQFDFISHRQENCAYDDEIEALGGRVYRVRSLGQAGPVTYINQLKDVISNNSYVAVHSHTDFQCGFPALAAKLSGVKRRICHSHSNHFPKGSGLKKSTVLRILKSMIRYSATDYCACSREAAEFLFGSKMAESGKVQLLRNGIDVMQFTDMAWNDRLNVREEFDIPDEAMVIGHIGRFSESKNHEFFLKVMKRLLKEQPHNVVGMLVGDGPLLNNIKEKAKQLGLLQNLRFLGVRSDIPRLMRAFDVFLFPSLYEGFGIVALEAQCSGTPCVMSDTVPKNTDMGLELVSFLSLSESPERWTQEINKAFLKERPERNRIMSSIIKRGYDIQSSIPEWMRLYE